MSGFIPGFQHSFFPPVDSVFASSPESNTPSLDSFLKEAASSAQVYLNDDEESLSQSSIELETNYSRVNTEHFLPLNLFQDSCSLKSNTLPSYHKEILENLQSKISYQINYFALESETEINEVKLICKICCKILQIAKVEEHVRGQEHLRNLVERCNSKISASEPFSKENRKFIASGILKSSRNVNKYSHNMNLKGIQKNTNNGKSSFVPAFLAQAELNKKYSVATESLYGSSDKVVQDLTSKLQEYMNHFEPYETRWNKPCFTCKMCKIPFPCKNARLHIYSNTHLRNLRKSLSIIKLEASDARNKTIVKRLVRQFNNRLYFFQLISDNELNELYFICKVCTLVLIPECLKNHIYSSEHSKNLQENPVVLNYDSLNDYNKQIVRKLNDAIQIHRIKDFTFVYRVGTEELRFYCKCCQLVLIPEKVEDHVKTSEHFKAAEVESNLKRHTPESDSTINATAPPKIALNYVDVTPPLKSEHENITTVGFDSLNPTNKAIVKILEDEFDSELIYFDLLQAVDTNELYFKCTLCDLTLKHTLVAGHVMCSGHMKSWELNVHFEDYLSLEESSKKILRKLFFEVGSKLNAFCLTPDIENRGLRFTCKFCNITLCSDFVISHLQTKKHKKKTREECSEDYATTVSNDSLQHNNSNNDLDSELTIHQIAENIDPLSVGIRSSPASSGLYEITPDLNLETIKDCVEGVSKELRGKTMTSDLNPPSGPNEICFVCQDCSTNVHFKSAENNGLHQRIAEKLFINCQGKSAETILSTAWNCKVSNNNTADCKTSLLTLVKSKSNVHGLESNGVNLCPNPTALCQNSLKSRLGVLSGSDKEILKTLIDKIGIKINNFDIMLTADSSELRVKCKFCSEMMDPETAENHINHEAHVKYSQLSCTSNLGFEYLNDSNKEIVRKLFNQVGKEINYFDATVTLSFVCKICGVNVNAETVSDHISSAEHFKCLLDRDSQDTTVKRNQDCNRDHINIERTTPKTASHASTHFFAPVRVNQNSHDLNFRSSIVARDALTHPEFELTFPKRRVSRCEKYFSSEDKTIEITASKEMIKTSSFSDLTSMTASGKSEVDSKDPNPVVSSKSVEKYCHGDKIQQNLLFSPHYKFSSVVATNRQSQNLRDHLGSDDLKSLARVQNKDHTTAVYSEIKYTVQNPSLSSARNLNSTIEAVKCTASEKITQKADAINFANNIASRKFEFGSKVFSVVLPPEPAKKYYGDEKIKKVSRVSSPEEEFAPSVGTNKKSEVLEHPSGSNDSVFSAKAQKNFLSTAADDALTFPGFKSKIQNSSVSRGAKCFSSELNKKPRHDNSRMDIYLTCAACCLNLQKTHIEDIADHVNSEDHKIRLNRSPVIPQFSNLSNYNEKIVEMLTGNISQTVNHFDILYEMPLKELCFYCKLCHIMLRAEVLLGHVNHVHLNNFTEKNDANHAWSNTVDDAVDCDHFNFEELNQKSRLFLCQVCNYKVYDEGVNNHLKSERHLHLSNICGDSLRFKSFSAYKEKVVAMLCCETFIKASDFDFFLETGSPKLYLYCKPCKILLWPESLLNHLKITSTHLKDVKVAARHFEQTKGREFDSTENSSKCSLM